LKKKKKQEEDKIRRREEKKKKKEELRKAGLLLSKEEKKKQKLAKEKLEQMRAQGFVVPDKMSKQVTTEAGIQAVQSEEKDKSKTRRPIYGKKKKQLPQKEANKDAATLSPKETAAAPSSAEHITDTTKKTATPIEEVKKEIVEESKKQEPPQETNDLSWEDVDDPDELEKQKQLEKHKAEKKTQENISKIGKDVETTAKEVNKGDKEKQKEKEKRKRKRRN